MRDNTAKDDRHTLIKSGDIASFGVTCNVMVDATTKELSRSTRVLVSFVQESGEMITHELTIGETLELKELFHKVLSELNDIAAKKGEDET